MESLVEALNLGNEAESVLQDGSTVVREREFTTISTIGVNSNDDKDGGLYL